MAAQPAIGRALHHVHGSHAAGRGGQLVEVGHHAFLVGHGHVQTHQVGVGGQQGRQLRNCGQLEQVVLVLSQAQRIELLIEVSLRKRVAKGAADKPKLTHDRQGKYETGSKAQRMNPRMLRRCHAGESGSFVHYLLMESCAASLPFRNDHSGGSTDTRIIP